jgi:hypothetical protein
VSLVVEIDSIAFAGLTEAEGARATSVFARHLTDLLTKDGLPDAATLAALSRIDLDSLTLGPLPPTATPEAMGRVLAQRLYDRVAR